MFERGEKPTQQTRGWNEVKGQTFAQREKEEANDYRYFPEPDIPPMIWDESQVTKIRESLPELPQDKKIRFVKLYGFSDYDATMLTETKGKADYFEECLKVLKLNPKINIPNAAKTIANWIINRSLNFEEVLPAKLIERIVKASQTAQIPEAQIEKAIKQAISDNPKAVKDYQNGKTQVIGFLLAQVQKILAGKGSPQDIFVKLKSNLK